MWGFDLNQNWSCSINNTTNCFNYWDYIDAWDKIFYYKNPNRKHSWFVKLKADLKQSSFPTWFLIWWNKVGPEINILPKEIQSQFLKWKEFHPNFRGGNGILKGLKTLQYFVDYGFPWIFKWDYTTEVNELDFPVLQRTYWFRWWNKYEETELKIKEIEKDYESYIQAIKPTSTPNANPFEAIKETVKSLFPHLTEEEILTKCLDTLKESFIPKDDTSMKSSSSNNEEIYLGESQELEEPTIADYLDGISMILEKNKGKGPVNS